MKNRALAKEFLLEALLELLKTKQLRAISISELCQAAGISRMSFYRNYSSIEQIIIDYHDSLIKEYRAMISANANDDKSINYENVVSFFKFFKPYTEVTRCRYENIPGKMILESITEFALDYFSPEKGSRRYYEVLSYAGALCAIYMAWAENGTKESPEKLADIIYERFGSWSS